MLLVSIYAKQLAKTINGEYNGYANRVLIGKVAKVVLI